MSNSDGVYPASFFLHEKGYLWWAIFLTISFKFDMLGTECYKTECYTSLYQELLNVTKLSNKNIYFSRF